MVRPDFLPVTVIVISLDLERRSLSVSFRVGMCASSFSGAPPLSRSSRQGGVFDFTFGFVGPPTRSNSLNPPAKDAGNAEQSASPLNSFQHLENRTDRIPIAGRGRHSEKVVNRAQTSDGPHFTPVNAEKKSIVLGEDSHQPLAACRNANGDRRRKARLLAQYAHEANHIGRRRLAVKRIVRCGRDQFLTSADHYLGLKWYVQEQFGAQAFLAEPTANHKCSGCADVDYAVILQFVRENAWAKAPVPAHVDAP